MEDNLISKRSYTKKQMKTIPSPYRTKEQALDMVEKYKNVINTSSDTFASFQLGMLVRLQSLYNELLKQEQKFYAEFGLSGPEALNEIRRRIKTFQQAAPWLIGADGEGSDSSTELIMENIYNAIGGIDEDVIVTALNTALESSGMQVTLDEEVNQIVNNLFADVDNKHAFKGGSSKGINSQLEIKQDSKGKIKIMVKESGSTKLTNHIKSTLASLLNQFNKGNEKIAQIEVPHHSKDVVKKVIQKTIMDNCKDSSVYHPYIDYEILKRIDKYAQRMDRFAIKGMLGEIYWNACINYLFQGAKRTIPAGEIKNIKGKDLSVDIILKNISGFQVKMWTLHEGTKITNKSMGFGHFLQNRAEILDTYVGRTIAQMFGIAGYTDYKNLEQENQTFLADSWADTYQGKIAPMVSKDIYPKLTNIFNSVIDNIMEISSEHAGTTTSSLLGSAGEEKTYMNTFWLINDKFLPSSAIIKSMIDNVDSEFINEFISFDLIKLEQDTTRKKWPTLLQHTYDDAYMADYWDIKYSTKFDVDKLLKETINNLR